MCCCGRRERQEHRDAALNQSESDVDLEIGECPREITATPHVQAAAPKFVVVRKAYLARRHRLRVDLSVTDQDDAPLVFDGRAQLTCNNNKIRLYDAAVDGNKIELPWQFDPADGGWSADSIYAEGLTASDAVDDTTITLTLQKTAAHNAGPAASDTLTCVELQLNIHAPPGVEGGGPGAALAEPDKVTVGRVLQLQDARRSRERAKLVLHRARPHTWAGNLVLESVGNRVAAYDQQVPAADQNPVCTQDIDLTVGNGTLHAVNGRTFWVQGVNVSADMRDSGFGVQVEGIDVDGDQVKATVVEIKLEIFRNKQAPDADPAAMSEGDKIDVGRFVQLQDNNLCGRAKLLIHKARPHAFTGTLRLLASNNRVSAFTQEVAAGGQAAVCSQGANLDTANGDIDPAGRVLWVQGENVSGALRDTGFKLRIQDNGFDGDEVKVTVAEFTRIRATIHPTPAHTVRAGNAPADHTFDCTSIDPDFGTNEPLVLMHNAQPDTALVLTANPAGLPVEWAAVRNSADHATLGDVAAIPTVTPDGGNAYQAELNADDMGSFRVRAYIDTSGAGGYRAGDPSIPLNLVLANATVVQDNSVVHAANLDSMPAVHGAIGGYVMIKNGDFSSRASSGMDMEVVADLTGGGADGRLGLNKVFFGLVNNVTAQATRGVYTDNTGHAPVSYRLERGFFSNRASATGTIAGGDPRFRPTDPAPVVLALPLLDSGRNPNGAGGNTATMTSSGRWDTRVNRPVGERVTMICIDSPGTPFLRQHSEHAAALLQSIQADVDFRSYYCFWTNISGSAGATGDPGDRVYSVIRTASWTIRGSWDVNPTAALMVLNNTTVHAIAYNGATVNPIGRVQDAGGEVRPPSAITDAFAWRDN